MAINEAEIVEVESSTAQNEAVAAEEKTVVCIITGEPKKATEKEKTLQAIARTLSSEYGFDTTDMARDFKLAYVDPDSGKSRSLTASIVVFAEDVEHEQAHVNRVCVIQDEKVKPTDKKNGIKLLEDALGAVEGDKTAENPGCEFGLWTNGSELHFMQKKYETDEPDPIFEELSDFPGKDESLDDLDRPDRQMLRVAAGESLLRTFKRCHDYIYGNQGKIKTAFWELLNIIFCKIYDERRRDICLLNNDTYRRKFWVGVKERNTPRGQAKIAERIKALFEDVKKADDYKDVFVGSEEITLNDRVLSYIASEISRYSFLEASIDVKGVAYESIVSNTLKQERGQFFTPRNVIRLMVEMLDPDESDYILDPACGSGGFLVMALDHVRHKIAKDLYPDEEGVLHEDRANSDALVMQRAKAFARDKIFGFDFDSDLKKASRMNMVMSGDGHGNIFSFNSLEFPRSGDADIKEALQRGVKCSPAGGSFTIIFTNPPFGSKIPIDEPSILENYELGHRWRKVNGKWTRSSELLPRQPPEILFIERCYQFLQDGGKMAVVLPDGILGNPELEYVRYWILQNMKVLASVDLPVETFLPQVGVQASLLFLQRKTYEERLLEFQPDYRVFMAIAEKVGKNRRGTPIYQRDESGSELYFSKEVQDMRKLPDGERVIRTLKVFERILDDDLPLVLKAWRSFKNGEEVC